MGGVGWPSGLALFSFGGVSSSSRLLWRCEGGCRRAVVWTGGVDGLLEVRSALALVDVSLVKVSASAGYAVPVGFGQMCRFRPKLVSLDRMFSQLCLAQVY
ncbi:hypothetical protein QQ045_027228 [Rhodiola kirilowii]